MCNSVNADGSSGPPIRGELSGLYAGLPPLEDRPPPFNGVQTNRVSVSRGTKQTTKVTSSSSGRTSVGKRSQGGSKRFST